MKSTPGIKDFIKYLIVLSLLVQNVGCKSISGIDYNAIKVSDIQATNSTKLLYHNIQRISRKAIAFGHQDATAYGIGWKHDENSEVLKSDIKKVVGALPVVHGYDIGHIELGKVHNLDTVSFDLMRNHIQKLYDKGAIITMSWHLDNPVTGGSSWDKTPAVPAVLEGGEQRDMYVLWVKRLAEFFNSLKDKQGNVIPIVFRPFHEMNGSWFWWGGDNVSPEDYKQLWKETQQLLKENNVHSLLYAYSPNTIGSEEEFEKYYPGDDFVDILGVDIYNHSCNEAFTKDVKRNLEIVKEKALLANKPFALTETGNNNFGEDPLWWTQTLYPGIKDSGAAWMLLWRNARPSHYFSTYPGEISEENFKEFAELEEIIFLDEVKELTTN
ncbi:glycosyl hydrolase [Salinimicrobium sp. MT39]|uniref:Mannan endo-1,4-beta-mannosidase n=1 Tax=Salinimicrobium profundisediminis TaxID=2994553 RepID=A0A9X3CTU0_9FLAO|nr:glycosyl hydrolase [Salinimicrobium profundisediminis]MCX2836608.1 glycosyl hydrolase [Salinimicrobium profundisediminis]